MNIQNYKSFQLKNRQTLQKERKKKERLDSVGKWRDKNIENSKNKEKRKRIKKSPNEAKMSILKKISNIWFRRMYCKVKKFLEKIGWSWYRDEKI